MKLPKSSHVDQIEMGFAAFAGEREAFTNLHRHNELELGIMSKGSQTAMFGSRMQNIALNCLGVFWANRPHGPVKMGPETYGISLFIPFPWFLNWHLPGHFVQAILHGEVIWSRPKTRPCSDVDLMLHWAELMNRRNKDLDQIVLLEVEARLRLLAHEYAKKAKSLHGETTGDDLAASYNKYEQMVVLLAERYSEPLTVQDIADAIGVDRSYAMRLFRKMSGTTIQQCLIQHRVSHAQRLLATTNKKILTVAMESGFSSISPFYASFHRIVGQTPQKYRQSLRKGKNQETGPKNRHAKI